MKIEKPIFDEEKQQFDIDIDTQDYDHVLIRLTEAALNGAAPQIAARHDFKIETLAKHAVALAKATIQELRRNG